MLPFASALAIAALGQTLVVMQGGIDLSVAGGLSLYVVIVTHYPAGENSQAPAGNRHRVSRRDRRRLAERVPDRPDAPQPDRRDARHERVALRRRALVHGRHPDDDHRSSGEGRRRALARHPGSGVLRRRCHGCRHGGGQADAGGPSLRGRRRERDRALDRRDPGEAPSDRRLRLGADPLLPRGRAARRHRQSADGVRGRQLSSAVRRSSRARRHLAARRSRQPRRDRGRRSLPVAARPVRARARRDVRHAHSSSRRRRSRWASRSTRSTGGRSRDACRGVGRRASRPPDAVVFTAGRGQSSTGKGGHAR